MIYKIIAINPSHDFYHVAQSCSSIFYRHMPNCMKHNDLEELRIQTEYWRSKIGQIENENIRFKTRLTKILQSGLPRNSMDAIEYFQNRFIQLDELITLLKHEVREHLLGIMDSLRVAATNGENMAAPHEKLESDLIILHNTFANLEMEFGMYLRQFD